MTFDPAQISGAEIRQRFMSILKERILVIDGATGTALQELDLTAEDFGGEDL